MKLNKYASDISCEATALGASNDFPRNPVAEPSYARYDSPNLNGPS